jgi:large subunit ribosomal protein L21
MQAVIRSGNHQFLVTPGQILEVDLVGDDVKTLKFEPLLIIDGEKVTVGTPVVAGVSVTADVVEMIKGDKLKVLKFQPKKRVKKLTGHRQRYTRIKITAIGSAKAPAKAAAAKKAPATPKKTPVAA